MTDGHAELCACIILFDAADLSIVIRTAIVTPARPVRYGIGGAIVALSDPAAEFEDSRPNTPLPAHLTDPHACKGHAEGSDDPVAVQSREPSTGRLGRTRGSGFHTY
ncbi:hypothetical protein GCM10010211_78380 [Streptomyces albospinus]|uniref:Chorismate-utilising enzyme C-terminal domain-containing protein n=1 Tax=Streptomyces albospinus TaxID=285515 RepID=A0ABQ2VQS8_9ACTN|nr:hypothetical protein GCM10010211_78380 [Streptomyces albospinus]